jgi:hypothetical protein
MEVLFEYKGSKRTIKCTAATELRDRICGELNALGVTNSSVGFASESETSSRAFILQRFSSKWNTFVDVNNAEDIANGDRLTVTPSPVAATQKVKI